MRVPETSNEAVVRSYWKAHQAYDWDEIGRLRHDDWTIEFPQSGERIRGHANDRAAHESYPGGLPDIGPFRLAGTDDRWVVSPSFTVHHIVGSGNAWWADGSVTYPDGTTWFGVVMMKLRDGKVHRETAYFAPRSDPPAWRARWVERME